ncbi:hypothetical protein CAP36_02210 [Chitinophagaceae bacterium IBVUCB2]|nr:hypothetical protein CAP36_02210 [Chitinophagaceae bacterium IBVUCB2]
MNRIVFIFLSLLLLNGTTEFHQVWKLPLLARHYGEHCKKDPHLDFFSFLKTHYLNQAGHKDDDDNRDRELPFKSTGTIAHTDISDFTKKVTLFVPSINNCIVANTYHPEGMVCHKAFSIFHPPRFS